MEDDRATTNPGLSTKDNLLGESVCIPKQPKRRFVGRKKAEQVAGKPVDLDADIEDSNAIQGTRYAFVF